MDLGIYDFEFIDFRFMDFGFWEFLIQGLFTLDTCTFDKGIY